VTVALSQDSTTIPDRGWEVEDFVFSRRFKSDHAMLTLHGIPGPYRLFFVSFDCHEPTHVHVQRERETCKYWMETAALASNHGFSPVELNTIRQSLRENRSRILEAWDEHCGHRS